MRKGHGFTIATSPMYQYWETGKQNECLSLHFSSQSSFIWDASTDEQLTNDSYDLMLQFDMKNFTANGSAISSLAD